jgi:aerobic C4-dicarboxylate transport protein
VPHVPVAALALIFGIDRFMSEARALTNFTGNAVATVLIGTWVKEIDGGRVDRVLAGAEPFDEETMLAGHSGVQDVVEEPAAQPVLAHA